MAEQRISRRLINYFRDTLPPEGVAQIRTASQELSGVWRSGAGDAAVTERTLHLRSVTERWVIDPARNRLREAVDICLVALVVALSVRAFFVQPMAIPTGSMQPTLYGVTVENLLESASPVPSGIGQFFDRWIHGRRYFEVTAKCDGRISEILDPEPILPILPQWKRQRFKLGTEWHTIWFHPSDLPNPWNIDPAKLIFGYARVTEDHFFKAGETILRLAVNSGDHILVDRLSYHFRRPERGEIVVFRTAGIAGIPEATYYIKRLVGLGGDRVRIGDDRHLVINGRRLDSQTPRFEQVYTFVGPPKDSQYSGHLNDRVAQALRMRPRSLAPRFPNGRAEFLVRPGHLLVMGDNSVSSLDGRQWGDFPANRLVGRFWAVYWPVGERFGRGQN
ncbi:MAG: signal peptidase I [Verrucomicrobia bacterium]|nr:signal peptidase I [Verrucomicrobiota bacterium]